MQYFCSTWTRFNQTFVHQVVFELNDMTAYIISGLLSSKHNSKDILGKIFWIWFMLEFRLTMKRSIIGIAKPVYVLWYVCCKAMSFCLLFYCYVVYVLCSFLCSTWLLIPPSQNLQKRTTFVRMPPSITWVYGTFTLYPW